MTDINKVKAPAREMAFVYDLDLDGALSGGQLVVSEGELASRQNDQELWRHAITSIGELKLTTNIGCGFIECKIDGSDKILCRMTSKLLKSAGEFVKAFNYYVKTGQMTDLSEDEKTACPKCGRPFMEGSSICMYCVKKTAIFGRALRLMKPYMKKFITAGVILTISNMLYVLTPVLNRILIDDYLKLRTGTVANILLICAGIFGLRAAGELLFILCSRVMSKAGALFAGHLRHLTYDKIQKLSMSSLSRKTTGDLLKRITQDTQKVREFLIDQGRWLFEMSIQFMAILIIVFTTQPFLAMLIILPAPFALWFSTSIWKHIMLKYDRQWRLFSRSNSILHDIIKGIRVVKAFGNEEREIGKFGKSCKDLAQVSKENEQLFALFFPAIGFIIGIGEFFVLYFGGEMVLGRKLTVGELVQFTQYIALIYGPLRWMASLPRWLADVMTSLLKIFEILDEELEIRDVQSPQNLQIKGQIEFDEVVFGYKPYEPVLKNISLCIRPGEMIGLVGPSGTGKSTLINLIMRLYDVNSGQLKIDGVNIRNISQQALHESIGVVFQENFLFAGTILENIAYAKPDASYDDIIEAAKIANAHEFIIKLPDAYNTTVGENGYSLSGGERQRVAIARAILRNPSILILDEATSSLDVETEAKIQEALGRLVKGRTTIAIAHRLSTLRGADRLMVLDHGELVETGTHNELMRKKGVYHKLVMVQLQNQKKKTPEPAAVSTSN